MNDTPPARPAALMPQHVDDAGGWCPGSGWPHERGRCPAGCAASHAQLTGPGPHLRTEPGTVLEAAAGYQVRRLLNGGPVLPDCAAPLDPEPARVHTELHDPCSTVLVFTYPGGVTRRVWVTVELEYG